METGIAYEHQESLLNQPSTSNGHHVTYLTQQEAQQIQQQQLQQQHQQQQQQQQLLQQQYQQQQQQIQQINSNLGHNHQIIQNHHQIQIQPTTSNSLIIDNNSILNGIATAGTSESFAQLHIPPLPIPAQAKKYQNPYEYKCSLLEYHIHEAILINKALKSELQQYREKIDFEKRLRGVLVDRVKNLNPSV